MNALELHLDDYLGLRRMLGHDLADAHRLLPRFVEHLGASKQEFVTIQAALAWALQTDTAAPSTVPGRRMMAARGFARYLAGIDARTEIPPAGLIPIPRRWRRPFIYTDTDVLALMDQARRVIGQPLRAATIETLIGLLAATGLRVREALRLDRSDIETANGVLQIRRSKFGKFRQVPLLPSSLEALDRYDHRRRQLYPHPNTNAFFVSLRGTRVIYETVWPTHRMLCERAGVGAGSPVIPRIHDLRHTFTVRALLSWYRDGVDVQARLSWLSTYLGHREPRYTYWYLSAAPELLAHAARRLDDAQVSR